MRYNNSSLGGNNAMSDIELYTLVWVKPYTEIAILKLLLLLSIVYNKIFYGTLRFLM